MKRQIITFLILVMSCTTLIAQNSRTGMKYQAIARDISGIPMANEHISVKVEMVAVDAVEKVIYEERHNATSNPYGLINLTIGEGDQISGAYDAIHWSDQNIWIRISLKKKNDADYSIVTMNRPYSVPYAHFATQAGSLTDNGTGTPMPATVNQNNSRPNQPSGGSVWSTRGNVNADRHNDPPVIGTTDDNPLVLITNNLERMRINEDGTVEITGDLDVGEDAIIGNDLTVKEDVFLNTEGGATEINGPTTIGGADMNSATFTGNAQIDKDLNVSGNSNMEGDLNVDGESTFGGPDMNPGTFTGNVQIDKDLNVSGNSNTEGDLNVDGESTFGGPDMNPGTFTGNVQIDKDLNVSGNSNTEGDLNVDGESTFGGPDMNPGTFTGNVQIDKDLNVDGEFTVNGRTTFDIEVTGEQTEQASYPVLIKGSQQGLAIELVPAVSGSDEFLMSHRGNNYISFWRDGAEKGRIEGMGRADLDPTGLLSLLVGMIQNPPSALTDAGVTYNPFGVGNPDDLSGLLNFGDGDLPDLINNLSFSPNALASIDWEAFSFDPGSQASFSNSLDWDDGKLPFLDFLSIESLVDFSNPFGTSDVDPFSTFINSFNGETAGSPANTVWSVIKSSLEASGMYPDDPTNFESQIFSNYTLDVLLQGIATLTSTVTFLSSLASVLDPEDVFSEGVAVVSDVVSLIIYGAYADINLGVAYESGAGDYAEWLERADVDELIRPGDVVGVIGGKVSREFNHADQFMVVSTSPLLLGNMPENKKQERDMEKVAFMGQVPVKVTGIVHVGDYILPSGNGDGLGIAVSPENMLARDYQRIIGVAWEENTNSDFVKLVNTAVGINHNDMSNVIEEMQSTLNHIQVALEKLDPSFQAQIYDVSEKNRTAQVMDYHVSTTHDSKVTSYFSESYNSRKEMLLDVRTAMVEKGGVDMTMLPWMDRLFEHPEEAMVLADHFQSILDEMVTMRDEIVTAGE